MIKPSFCNGTIIHERCFPQKHRFKYNMSWCLFDLDKIESLFYASKFWSINKFNIVSIRNRDYINPNPESINIKIRKFIKEKTSQRFDGKVFLFTHPRYLGFGFNSVNFYFCFEDAEIKYIVSEINNTPWKEKHLYFHDNTESAIETNESVSKPLSFKFKKEFHISPFIDMDINYHWEFFLTEKELKISMAVSKDTSTLLNVYLNSQLKSIESPEIAQWTLKKPFQALKMHAGIYWQALKLWLKKVPVYTHPNQKTQNQSKNTFNNKTSDKKIKR